MDLGSSQAVLTQAQRNVLTCAALTLLTYDLHTAAERSQFHRGCVLYHNETFGGNGRTCTSCHLFNVGNGNPDDNNFDLSIEDVEVAFAANPLGPLFRELDSDDGLSAAEGGVNGDFSKLLSMANVRIPLGLHGNVTVLDDGSPLISDDARTVTVWRSTPTSENITFDRHLTWDGRFGDDLERQFTEAVITHYKPTRLPTAQEAADGAFFQRHLFSNKQVRASVSGDSPPTLPEVPASYVGSYWDSVRRGRRDFESVPVTSSSGFCATCHSGPMLNLTNEFNPVQAPGEAINNNFVSELNFLRPPETQLPVHSYTIVLDHPVFMPDIPIADSPFMPPPGTPLFPPGTVFTVTSPDLGLLMTNGDPCLVPAACVINCGPGSPTCGTTSFFKTPTLWGAADSAPYFHDNSARDIQEVMQIYRALGQATADGLDSLGLDGEGFRLSEQRVTDIINAFEFLFGHRPILAP
jgi:cytochrome c peroxidase